MAIIARQFMDITGDRLRPFTSNWLGLNLKDALFHVCAIIIQWRIASKEWLD